ncbi:hypothetical protein MTO96_000107 [Rhipicephalus appendiculatus]
MNLSRIPFRSQKNHVGVLTNWRANSGAEEIPREAEEAAEAFHSSRVPGEALNFFCFFRAALVPSLSEAGKGRRRDSCLVARRELDGDVDNSAGLNAKSIRGGGRGEASH